MRFFARVVFLCNCCFILAVVLNKIEQAHKKVGNFNGAIQINSVESTLVILGYGAIIINFIFNILLLILFVSHSNQTVAAWLRWLNFIILLTQIYYFFF